MILSLSGWGGCPTPAVVTVRQGNTVHRAGIQTNSHEYRFQPETVCRADWREQAHTRRPLAGHVTEKQHLLYAVQAAALVQAALVHQRNSISEVVYRVVDEGMI